MHVLKEKKNQILSSVFIAGVLMLAASLCMYSAEHAAQPEAFRNAFDGLWWSVSALLTVGYGDIYLITITGKIMAIVISLLGAGTVAIPDGIISAGFVEQYIKAQETGKDSLTADLYIDIDSAWLGMSVQEVKEKTGQTILYVQREDETFVPDESYNVQVSDRVTVFVHQDHTGQSITPPLKGRGFHRLKDFCEGGFSFSVSRIMVRQSDERNHRNGEI